MRARAATGLPLVLLLSGCSLVFSVDGYEVGARDGGASDAGSTDAGTGDGGRDAATEDDAGPEDAGADAGAPDAGSDGGPPARCTDAAHGCDLTIGCTMASSVPGAGSTVRVPFSVTNLGARSGAGPFRIAVDMDHGGTFEEVGSEAFPAVLMALETQSGEVAFVVPTWVVPGENALRCRVDADDEVPEPDETNNEDASSFVASGLPDLHFPYVSVSSSPSNPFPTTFDIENSGPTSALMVDWLISGGADCCGGGSLMSEVVPVVEAGETVRITRTVSHMLAGTGPGDVLYRLDRFDDIPESDETDNDFTRAVTW